MFISLQIVDTVRVPPSSQTRYLESKLLEILTASFCGRVLANCGICLLIEKITNLSEQRIVQNDCNTYVTVHFSVIAFRPYIGEIFTTFLVSQHPMHGLALSTGFCDTILVPPSNLPEYLIWDNECQGFINTPDFDTELDFELGGEIKIRVVDVIFRTNEDDSSMGLGDGLEEELSQDLIGSWGAIVNNKSKFIVVGTCIGPGLGDIRWWREDAN
ncbi:DNA-directed RNA polymerase I, II, and III, subunit 7 [Giardia duodenalis]|uniref:DNA-directed RNA polymerase III subunit 22.9 kDa polypeptide n=2 Tax=Giardia intestinalis TaxID=5741 RepID=C6LV80_GIAIB|nr:DNA-directed RNA polymerase III subunit 22.9 kDa polypeptide [Giardia intestinalis ATCC 50581]ESU43879.1 DNA-directed RNA polymerase I, II, and III, subunit 7 [Giardia intestinalis]